MAESIGRCWGEESTDQHFDQAAEDPASPVPTGQCARGHRHRSRVLLKQPLSFRTCGNKLGDSIDRSATTKAKTSKDVV